jgi:hypothetical protein
MAQSPLVINVPGFADTITLPGMDDAQAKRDRVSRFRAHALASPLPEPLLWVPRWITALDNVQDALSTFLILGRPLWRRLPAFYQIPLAWALDVNHALNVAESTLGLISGGRVPKLSYYVNQQLGVSVRPGRVAQARAWLESAVYPFGFVLTAGQVLHDLTGYGLVLGGIMGFVTDTLWAGVRYFATGRRSVVVLPPASDPLMQAVRLLQDIPFWMPATPAMTHGELQATALAVMNALDIVSEPPAIPDAVLDFGSIGYERTYYDPFTDTVHRDYVQTASPFVDALTEFPLELPMTPQEMQDEYGSLPVVWPWDPVSNQSLDAAPYAELHRDAVAVRAGQRQAEYIEGIRNSQQWSDGFTAGVAGTLSSDPAKAAVTSALRESVLDHLAFRNANQQLLEYAYDWREKLLARAIEDNIFPAAPRHVLNYTDYFMPLASPVALDLAMPAFEQIDWWLARARYLWTHRGALWWQPLMDQGDGHYEWVQTRFGYAIPDPARYGVVAEFVYGTTKALAAASMEAWGAIYHRLWAGTNQAPATANWQVSEPSGVTYTDDRAATVAYYGLRTLPSNAPQQPWWNNAHNF